MSTAPVGIKLKTSSGREFLKGTGGAAHVDVKDIVLLAGEDQTNNVLVVEQGQFPATSVARTTSDANIGAAPAAGDYLQRVVVTVAPTTAALTISDGAGTVVCSIPTSAAIGTVVEVGCVASTSGFVVDLHASGAGTVTCIGRFT